MQYADGGNLRTYLQTHFSTLTWDDKIKLAYQISEGIKYLHGENILHREVKIIDLGTGNWYHVFGMISYFDPKLLEDYSNQYNKKSDIYSLGVLMWELSSGKPPFIGENENILRYHLINGRRVDSIPNTPTKYLKLYQSCIFKTSSFYWIGKDDKYSRIVIDKVMINELKIWTLFVIRASLIYSNTALNIHISNYLIYTW